MRQYQTEQQAKPQHATAIHKPLHDDGALFVIQLEGVRAFRPNMATHPAFGEALARAAARGVRVEARACRVAPDMLEIGGPVPVELPPYDDERWKEGLK